MPLEPRVLLDHPGVTRAFRYTKRDTMLHALATGMGLNPLDTHEVSFAYDPPARALRALPTLANVLGWVDMARDPEACHAAHGIDPDKMVVAGIAMRLARPLAVEGGGSARSTFAELVDRGAGKAALVRILKETFDPTGTLLASMDYWMHVRDGGGFGGSAAGGPERFLMPKRAADASAAMTIPPNLALLYRLSLGDHNALHADPLHAQGLGFERPILHGLATFAIAVHAVLRETTAFALERFGAAQARTVAPVYPGDTLHTSMWRDGNDVFFQTRVLERNVTVLDDGRVTLVE